MADRTYASIRRIRIAQTVLTLCLALGMGSCSRLKDDVPTAPVSIAGVAHQAGWDNPTSPQFHGTALESGAAQLKDCARCHAGSYAGGTSGVSCFSCHASYPHMAGWGDTASASFHGEYLLAKHWDVSGCASCHGAQFTGGTTGVSCMSCHPPYPHDPVFRAAGGHPLYMLNNGFPFSQCQACHGTTFTGGSVVDISCSGTGCHADASGNPKSPEACNTCHGTFNAPANDLISAAPPRDVEGDTAASARGVGAHRPHLVTGTLGPLVACQECHNVPAQVSSPGHIDAPFAVQVVFNGPASRLVTGDGTNVPQPSYDQGATKCNNTFCHGNWVVREATSPVYPDIGHNMYTDTVMVGANASPSWTGGDAGAACGTCHGIPPKGHVVVPITACSGCHFDVDSNGNIIDPSKHMNGKINYMNYERDF